MYTYGYPSRGISPSASAISRFQATVLIRPQTSLPLLQPNAQPNAFRQIVKNVILQTHALHSPNVHTFKARNVRWLNTKIPNASSESRSQRCAWTGAILGKRDAARATSESQFATERSRKSCAVRIISFPSSLLPPGIISRYDRSYP